MRVRALGDAGIELELNACFATAEWADFAVVRERLLLEVLEVVEGSGARIAYPTRTVHVLGGATPAAAPPR